MSAPKSGEQRWLKPAEAAKELNCSQATVYRLIENGSLPGSWSYQLGKRRYWSVPTEAVHALRSE